MNLRGLYQTHYGLLYFWVLAEIKNKELAEDLCAAAFTKAFEHLGGLKDPGKFKPWLFQIAANEIKQHRRMLDRHKTDRLLPEHEQIPHPKDFIEELADFYELKHVEDALKMLGAIHRKALLRYLAGEPCQGTWGSRLHQARQELQTLIAHV